MSGVVTFHDDYEWLEAFRQMPAEASVQLDPDEQDRRSALIRRMRFELAQRAELKGRPSPQTRRLVEPVRDAAEILEGERA